MLIQAGAYVNAYDSKGCSVLCYAVMNMNVDCINVLRYEGADVKTIHRTYDTDSTVMFKAASLGHDKCLKLMIKEGADVNRLNAGKQTPLLFSAQGGHCECMDILIKAGADVNISDEADCTALYYAAANGKNDCVEKLLEVGADVNKGCSQKPLISAAYAGHDTCVNTLLKAGADVNQKDSLGNTALILASRHGRINCIEILLENGADLNLVNNKGFTALIKAGGFSTSQSSCVKALLRAGAFINLCNEYGYNALTQHIILNRNNVISDDYILFAAGETINSDLMGTDFKPPTFMKPSLNLKDICRHEIRNHMIKINPHLHLFHRVPKLGLPPSLVRYLLFGVSLLEEDVSEDATNVHDFTTLMKTLK